MSRFLIRLPSLDDVKRFCTTANQHDCDIDVCVGRYIVNAKSIMGLFSIDRDQPVTVEFQAAMPSATPSARRSRPWWSPKCNLYADT